MQEVLLEGFLFFCFKEQTNQPYILGTVRNDVHHGVDHRRTLRRSQKMQAFFAGTDTSQTPPFCFP